MSSVGSRPHIYGQHLMLRLCEVERVDALDDAARISEFLASLVHAVKMRILEGPCVAAEGGDASHYGYSAVVILYESHAAIHTYPLRAEFFLDLFSCRAFDIQHVFEHCTRTLGGFTVNECTLFDRGHHWTTPAAGHLSEWKRSRHPVTPADPAGPDSPTMSKDLSGGTP